MSPAREVPALDPGLAVATLRWIDRIEIAYGPTIARVARKLTLYCAALGIDRIEISDRQLVSFFGMHRNDIMQAAHALEGEFRIRTTIAGRVWHVPPGLIDLPGQETLPFPPDEPGGDFLFPVEKGPTPGRYPEPQFSLLSKQVAWESRPPQTRNQEVTEEWPGNPGQQVVQETRPPGTDWLKPAAQRPYYQQIQTCGLGNQASGLRTQATPPSNSNSNSVSSAHSHASHARSFADPDPVEMSPAQEEAARIAAIHTLTPDQRRDALQLAAALHSYMEEFGDSHRTERRTLSALADDEEILARCLAVASLGALLQYLSVMRAADMRGCNSYGWFLTLFAHQLASIPKKIMKAALSTEKRSHRQTPKPKTQTLSHESAPPAQNQRQENETLLRMAAGRTRLL